MPAPKDPEKRQLWLARLSAASKAAGCKPPPGYRSPVLGLKGSDNPAFKTGLYVRVEATCPACSQRFLGRLSQRCCSKRCAAIITNPFKGKRHSLATRLLMSEKHADVSDIRNPGYRDGSSRRARPSFKAAALKALERDGHLCQVCGRGPPVKLDVHHLDFGKEDDSLGNLITLCASCHAKEHWRFFKAEGGLLPAALRKGVMK